MKIINKDLIDKISSEAVTNQRLRKNYNFHSSENDPLQRMLNAVEPGSYVRPHRHIKPAKSEGFIILRGNMGVIIFDNYGRTKDAVLLSGEGPIFGVDIDEGEWHTILSLEKGTIVYETKSGPYSPIDAKDFAPWAPLPEEKNKADNYLKYMESLFA